MAFDAGMLAGVGLHKTVHQTGGAFGRHLATPVAFVAVGEGVVQSAAVGERAEFGVVARGGR